MKLFLATSLMLLSTSTYAAQVSAVCFSKAKQAVSSYVEKSYYDKNGFDAYVCGRASNNKAVICEVSASKGDGAASDTYRVVLNGNCARVFRVELIGEE